MFLFFFCHSPRRKVSEETEVLSFAFFDGKFVVSIVFARKTFNKYDVFSYVRSFYSANSIILLV